MGTIFLVVSGFNAAEDMHGIRYMRLIGDGDSSVKCDIQQYDTNIKAAFKGGAGGALAPP